MAIALDEEARTTLLKVARGAISAAVSGGVDPQPPSTSNPALQQRSGVFVTIHLDGELRGCIGTLHSTVPLAEATADAARSAALRDPRFPALTAAELERIELEISVLSPFEKVTDPQTIVPGRDGLLIRSGYHSGLLLPQVATEQGWGREELLRGTCRKAGLPADAWREGSCAIEKFTADVFGEK